MAKGTTTTNPQSSGAPAAGNTGAQQPSSAAAGDNANGELVEVTPLGMSAEQMKKSNAEAVAEIEQTAANAAVEQDRKRLTDLKAAFADDPAFAMTAYEAGHTVTQAKAERHDVLAAANVELKKENEALTKQVEDGKVEFSGSDGEEGEGSESSQSEDEVEAAAMKVWNADASLREEFACHKPAFLADFKRNRKDYEKK